MGELEEGRNMNTQSDRTSSIHSMSSIEERQGDIDVITLSDDEDSVEILISAQNTAEASNKSKHNSISSNVREREMCPMCAVVFESAQDLELHLENVGTCGRKIFGCFNFESRKCFKCDNKLKKVYNEYTDLHNLLCHVSMCDGRRHERIGFVRRKTLTSCSSSIKTINPLQKSLLKTTEVFNCSTKVTQCPDVSKIESIEVLQSATDTGWKSTVGGESAQDGNQRAQSASLSGHVERNVKTPSTTQNSSKSKRSCQAPSNMSESGGGSGWSGVRHNPGEECQGPLGSATDGNPPRQQSQPQQKYSSDINNQKSSLHVEHSSTLPPKKPTPFKDPIEKVLAVSEDVKELEIKVNEFYSNSRNDKHYIYLDEMLTRNLITLDNIESEGREDVYIARKDCVTLIQSCIFKLESKVPLPSTHKTDYPMDVPGSQVPISQNSSPPSTPQNNKEELVELSSSVSTTRIPTFNSRILRIPPRLVPLSTEGEDSKGETLASENSVKKETVTPSRIPPEEQRKHQEGLARDFIYCKEHNKKFQKLKHGMQHLKKGHGYYRCPNCFMFVCSSGNHYKNHLKTHFIREEEIQCGYCERVKDYERMWEHIEDNHLWRFLPKEKSRQAQKKDVKIETSTHDALSQSVKVEVKSESKESCASQNVPGTSHSKQRNRSQSFESQNIENVADSKEVRQTMIMITPENVTLRPERSLPEPLSLPSNENLELIVHEGNRNFNPAERLMLVTALIQNPNPRWDAIEEEYSLKFKCQRIQIYRWLINNRRGLVKGPLPSWAIDKATGKPSYKIIDIGGGRISIVGLSNSPEDNTSTTKIFVEKTKDDVSKTVTGATNTKSSSRSSREASSHEKAVVDFKKKSDCTQSAYSKTDTDSETSSDGGSDSETGSGSVIEKPKMKNKKGNLQKVEQESYAGRQTVRSLSKKNPGEGTSQYIDKESRKSKSSFRDNKKKENSEKNGNYKTSESSEENLRKKHSAESRDEKGVKSTSEEKRRSTNLESRRRDPNAQNKICEERFQKVGAKVNDVQAESTKRKERRNEVPSTTTTEYFARKRKAENYCEAEISEKEPRKCIEGYHYRTKKIAENEFGGENQSSNMTLKTVTPHPNIHGAPEKMHREAKIDEPSTSRSFTKNVHSVPGKTNDKFFPDNHNENLNVTGKSLITNSDKCLRRRRTRKCVPKGVDLVPPEIVQKCRIQNQKKQKAEEEHHTIEKEMQRIHENYESSSNTEKDASTSSDCELIMSSSDDY